MNFKKRLVLLIAGILVAICFVSEIQAWGKKDNCPLYIDELGWEIPSALPGWKIVQSYEEYKNAGLLAKISESQVPKFQPYISFHGSGNFYGFALVVPDNITTYWDETSEITLTYTCDRDTLQATSYQYFFATSRTSNKLFFDYELIHPFSVPNPSIKLYATSKGNPVIFARFDFKRKEPERLLSCIPENVRSARKEVSRR
ncbi:MAG: hypothetical protein MUO58_19575 [Anaerolineales bacterium]|nr:hypothetical protein [Anaerolineales bacterium]